MSAINHAGTHTYLGLYVFPLVALLFVNLLIRKEKSNFTEVLFDTITELFFGALYAGMYTMLISTIMYIRYQSVALIQIWYILLWMHFSLREWRMMEQK